MSRPMFLKHFLQSFGVYGSMQFFRLNLPSFLTPSFLLMCAAAWLLFSSYHVLTPVVPLHMSQQGMTGIQLGVLVSAFMVSSLLIRPWAGKWADEISRKTLMLTGLTIFGLCSLGYFLPPLPAVWLPLRLVQGIGFALFNTAASSYVVKAIPAQHKAEAIGYYSNAIKLAMAIAPGAALWLASTYNNHWVFGASVVLAGGSWALVAGLKPTENTPGHSLNKPQKGKLFNREAAFPGLVMGLNSTAFGALIPFFPLLAAEKGLTDVTWFYTLYAVCLMASRFMTGRLSDRYGRVAVLIPGMGAVSVTLALMALPVPSWSLLGLAGLYGFAAGTVQPSLMAMAADRARDYEQGSAMATFTLFTDSGIALGSFLMGAVGSQFGYHWPLVIIALGVVVGMGLLWREHAITSQPVSSQGVC